MPIGARTTTDAERRSERRKGARWNGEEMDRSGLRRRGSRRDLTARMQPSGRRHCGNALASWKIVPQAPVLARPSAGALTGIERRSGSGTTSRPYPFRHHQHGLPALC